MGVGYTIAHEKGGRAVSTQAKTATVVRSALQGYTNTHVCLASLNPIRHHDCSAALATSTRACNKNTESRHDYDTATLRTILNFVFKHNSALVRSAGLSTRTPRPRGRSAASHRSWTWSLTPPPALARWGLRRRWALDQTATCASHPERLACMPLCRQSR